jgi:hypothetical protein
MTRDSDSWLLRLRSRSLAVRSAILFSTVAVFYAIVAPIGYLWLGSVAWVGAAAAAGICLVGALLAMIASHLLAKSPLYGMLLGMGFRMGIPLSFALIVHQLGGVLAEAGLLYYLVAFYPVTLAVETALSLPPAEALTRCPKIPQDVS